MSSALDINLLSRTLEDLLERSQRPVMLRDDATGQLHQILTSVAAAPDGLLPSFLAAGETVWRAATGRSLGVDQQRDEGSLLGHRVKAVHGAPFSIVMLAVMEATERTARPEALVISDFSRLRQELAPLPPATPMASDVAMRRGEPAP